MANLEVRIESLEERTVYGLWKKSNDRTIKKDIDSLSKAYHDIVSIPKGKVLPYFVLAQNYNIETQDFELFIGSNSVNGNLDSYILPPGNYAIITVKPKLGFLWGLSIGEAKRYFYTKWLSENPYKAINMEYEYHTEKSTGKSPTIDIVFAISKKLYNLRAINEI